MMAKLEMIIGSEKKSDYLSPDRVSTGFCFMIYNGENNY